MKKLKIDTLDSLNNMEEFALMISRNADLSGMRILSIETLEENHHRELIENNDNVISLAQAKQRIHPQQVISRELRINSKY